VRENRVVIGLGSNLGDRQEMLARAIKQLQPEIRPTTLSRVFETAPWGFNDQPAFLNQVILAETNLSAQGTLKKLKRIENDLGRQPNFRYGPRCIDLDILFFNDDVINTDSLVIPHPELTRRAFILLPLLDIAPDYLHPLEKKSIRDLAAMVSRDGVHVVEEKVIKMENSLLDWGKKTYVMGILNLTPDSFSGDSILQEKDPVGFAVQQACQFVQDGADIVDIGAESSRPGSLPISAEIELERLLPIVKAIIQEKLPALISIDTYKSEVAQACLDLGADWINDIWGLQKDPSLGKVATQYHTPIVLMHNRSKSDAVEKNKLVGSSYSAGDYGNFMEDLLLELKLLTENAAAVGIQAENIIIDPGIGFGKTVSQNLQIINHLDRIKSLGYPVLIGPSRKSFIGNVLDLPVDERIEGTAASIAIGVVKGADIIRVHDVRQMARTAAMADAIIRS